MICPKCNKEMNVSKNLYDKYDHYKGNCELEMYYKNNNFYDISFYEIKNNNYIRYSLTYDGKILIDYAMELDLSKSIADHIEAYNILKKYIDNIIFE